MQYFEKSEESKDKFNLKVQVRMKNGNQDKCNILSLNYNNYFVKETYIVK